MDWIKKGGHWVYGRRKKSGSIDSGTWYPPTYGSAPLGLNAVINCVPPPHYPGNSLAVAGSYLGIYSKFSPQSHDLPWTVLGCHKVQKLNPRAMHYSRFVMGKKKTMHYSRFVMGKKKKTKTKQTWFSSFPGNTRHENRRNSKFHINICWINMLLNFFNTLAIRDKIENSGLKGTIAYRAMPVQIRLQLD